MNKGNQLYSRSDKQARKLSADAGLCHTCGMLLGACLHDVVKGMLGEPEYSQWLGAGRTYDELLTKRRELAEARAQRDTRKGEPMHVDTGRLVRTPAHERK